MENASYICTYTPKGLVKLQLGFLTIVNKSEFDSVYAWCETQYYMPDVRLSSQHTHIQLSKLRHHMLAVYSLTKPRLRLNQL